MRKPSRSKRFERIRKKDSQQSKRQKKNNTERKKQTQDENLELEEFKIHPKFEYIDGINQKEMRKITAI